MICNRVNTPVITTIPKELTRLVHKKRTGGVVTTVQKPFRGRGRDRGLSPAELWQLSSRPAGAGERPAPDRGGASAEGLWGSIAGPGTPLISSPGGPVTEVLLPPPPAAGPGPQAVLLWSRRDSGHAAGTTDGPETRRQSR